MRNEIVALLAVAMLALLPVARADDDPLDLARARLAQEESNQKRARQLAERATRELAALLAEVEAHRIHATGQLQSAAPARTALVSISDEQLPQFLQDLYLARTSASTSAGMDKSLSVATDRQTELIRQLHLLMVQLQRSAATGASLQRAEKILRDQIELNGKAAALLREGFGKQMEDLVESVRHDLVDASAKQVAISREVKTLDDELAVSETAGPEKQRGGIARARKIITERKLEAAAQQAADQLAENNAGAAAAGQQLERDFTELVEVLRAATAGEEEVAPFDTYGPTLAELAARDKELKELLEKLNKMIAEAKLLKKTPEREELRNLQNMQEELNNMLVEISRNIPETTDEELAEKLKQMIRDALLAMANAGEAINDADAEELLEQLKVSLGSLNLAEAELRALLASLAALSAQQQQANDQSKETPAGIALGLGIRLGGNQTGASGPGAVLNSTVKARDLTDQDWGRLPPELRGQLNQAVRGKWPQEYKDLIERYYQNLAKGAQ
ncbi:MAG: hypothetical protein BIFFINMI_00468 [Phycisphaerae bacterium]|nr:hypothetical protein [Phycisphaerae bacterium]